MRPQSILPLRPSQKAAGAAVSSFAAATAGRPGALILAAALTAGFSLNVRASIILNDVNAARIQDADENGTGDSVQQNQMWVGNIASDDWGNVFVFQMTGASAGGILTADFSITQDSAFNAPTLVVDVFTRSSSAINPGDYQLTAGVTNLQTGFGVSSGLPTTVSLDAGGEANLASFLNSNWVENEHVFIRLNSSDIGPAPVNEAYRFGVTTGYTAESIDAQLTITAVPEASEAAVLGLGMLGLALVRRRKTERG